jgi:hypothetical protein
MRDPQQGGCETRSKADARPAAKAFIVSDRKRLHLVFYCYEYPDKYAATSLYQAIN